MPPVELSRHERDKFTLFCEGEAESSNGLAQQAEKIPNMAMMVKKLRVEAMAFEVVARLLRSTEEMSI